MQLAKDKMLRKCLIIINVEQLEAEIKRVNDQLQSTYVY
jgi:hypothetical protein